MNYYEFKISLSNTSKEPLIAKLFNLGCIGVIEDEGLTAYFDASQDLSFIVNHITASISEIQSIFEDNQISINYNLLPETDWNEEWKKSFTPIEIGKSLVITPPWLSTDKRRTEIIVDPAMAFGTGHHETTRRCLELIEQISQETDLSNFLDLGAGTGILSIAASRLGFKKVVAIDNDTLAQEAAIKNAQLNSLDNIEVILGTITDANGSFIMIAANLISETLIEYVNAINRLLADRGVLILSGMLQGQQDDVINKYIESGLTFREKFYDDKWVTLVFLKN